MLSFLIQNIFDMAETSISATIEILKEVREEEYSFLQQSGIRKTSSYGRCPQVTQKN